MRLEGELPGGGTARLSDVALSLGPEALEDLARLAGEARRVAGEVPALGGPWPPVVEVGEAHGLSLVVDLSGRAAEADALRRLSELALDPPWLQGDVAEGAAPYAAAAFPRTPGPAATPCATGSAWPPPGWTSASGGTGSRRGCASTWTSPCPPRAGSRRPSRCTCSSAPSAPTAACSVRGRCPSRVPRPWCATSWTRTPCAPQPTRSGEALAGLGYRRLALRQALRPVGPSNPNLGHGGPSTLLDVLFGPYDEPYDTPRVTSRFDSAPSGRR